MKKLLWYLLIAWWWYPVCFICKLPLYLVGYKWLWGKTTVKKVILQELNNPNVGSQNHGGPGVTFIFRQKDGGDLIPLETLLKDLKPFIATGSRNGYDHNVKRFWGLYNWLEIRVPIQFEESLDKLLDSLPYVDVHHTNTSRTLWYWSKDSKYINLGDH